MAEVRTRVKFHSLLVPCLWFAIQLHLVSQRRWL
jgi:hypothetical protein